MIRHIVATRFLSHSFVFSEDVLLSDDMINKRILCLKNNLLPSLKNQTNKNFIFVCLVNEKLPATRREQLDKLISKFGLQHIVLEYKKFDSFIKENWDHEKLILTRIDDDDFAFNLAVEDAQSKKTDDILIYGYCKGYTYFNKSDKIYDFCYDYDKRGHLGVFQSIIINTHNVKYRIEINPYKPMHTDMTGYFKKCNIKHSFTQNKTDYGFIYFRHEDNSSKVNNIPNSWKLKEYTLKDKENELLNRFNFRKLP